MSSVWAQQHKDRHFYGREAPALPKSRNDLDVLVERHRFIRDADEGELEWEDKLAKRAYDQLFKEFAVCDLSRYEEGKVAMRWRVASEVVAGRGHLSCGNLRCKHHHEVPMEGESTGEGSRPTKRKKVRELQTLTTSFAYVEAGEKKAADVTLVLCQKCADKLSLAKGGAGRSDESSRRRSASPVPRRRDADEAPISRDEAGVYIADGFGSYRPVADRERPPPKPDNTHPSSYTSLAERWKR